MSAGYRYSYSFMRLAAVTFAACGATGCGGRTTSEAPSENDQSVLSALTTNDDSKVSGGEQLPHEPAISNRRTVENSTVENIQVGPIAGGIEASLFMEKSPLGTTLDLVEGSERICVRGVQAPVPQGDYPNYWGGEIGLAFVSSPEEAAAPEAGLSVTGFTFRLEGALPPLLRFRVGAAGEVPVYSQYCQHVLPDTGVRIEMALDELTYECWNGYGLPFPGGAGATLMTWQIPANESTAGAFDFCIEDIRALR